MSPPPLSACTLEHWDSSELAPAERLAYWHDVAHNWVDVQPLSPGEQLQASWSLLRGEDCFFGTKQSSAYEMRTAARHVPPGEDMVVISLLQSGQMRLNAAPGEHQHASAGMLGLYVPYQDACYRWGAGARQTYIALPRREVAAALGREPNAADPNDWLTVREMYWEIEGQEDDRLWALYMDTCMFASARCRGDPARRLIGTTNFCCPACFRRIKRGQQ